MSQRVSAPQRFSPETTLYEGQSRALAQVLSGMEQKVRWIILVGPEGSGKSITLQALRAELRLTDADVVLFDGVDAIDPDDLLVVLQHRLGLPELPAPILRRSGVVDTIVAGRRSRTNPLVLLVDNADALSRKSLTVLLEVVQKSNTERSGTWIVLAGPSSLDAPAARAKVGYLHCRLGPLTVAEVVEHVDRRSKAVPGRVLKLSPNAVEQIAHRTAGIPGRIDALCDHLVRNPSVRLTNEVSAQVVEQEADRLGFLPSELRTRGGADAPDHAPRSKRPRWRRPVAAVLCLVAVAGVAMLGYSYGAPLARTSRDWMVAQLFPAEAPSPAPPPATAGRPRPSRREPAGAATASTRSTMPRPNVERRSGSDRPRAVAGEARSRPDPVSAEQMAALIEGARAGRSDDVARLLSAGVSPEVRDAGGLTPLMHATIHGHVEAARILLDKGARVNARDRGGITPTMLAVINERPEAIELLLGRDADVNAQTGSGWTALTFAAWKGDPDLVRTLLKHGATRNVVDKQGWTPLDYAAARLQSPPRDLDGVDTGARPAPNGRHAEVVPLLEGANAL